MNRIFHEYADGVRLADEESRGVGGSGSLLGTTVSADSGASNRDESVRVDDIVVRAILRGHRVRKQGCRLARNSPRLRTRENRVLYGFGMPSFVNDRVRAIGFVFGLIFGGIIGGVFLFSASACRQGAMCLGFYSPFLRDDWMGACSPERELLFQPGVVTCLSGVFGHLYLACDPDEGVIDPACVDALGDPFCEALLFGEFCRLERSFFASDISDLRLCVDRLAMNQGFDLPACEFEGTAIDDGSCEILDLAYDRLTACLSRRGSQDWSGSCFDIFRQPDKEFNPECPWWTSDECFDAANPP